MKVLERNNFHRLFDVLKESGFDIIGPTLQDQAIVYDRLEGVEDLPEGWTDEQAPGKYRLKKRNDKALFGYVVGPTSWKKFLYPPRQKLWSAQKTDSGFEVAVEKGVPQKMAFLGVRSCELAAIAVQDKVFCGGSFVDPHYKKRRANVLLIAVNCTEPKGTCFCVSMNTGPKALGGFDLSLTEMIEGERHYFLLRSGSPEGEKVLSRLPLKDAESGQQKKEDALLARARREMGRAMDTTNIKRLLYDNPEHPQWDKAAERCLSCANCTMACPTCFCSTVEDVSDLTGEHAERWRKWDSCFSLEFSYIHGGNVRQSGKARYRQWMTHKLASWQDQFGTSGCVGCGRCITWCPVGIDITEEVKAIRAQQPAGAESPG